MTTPSRGRADVLPAALAAVLMFAAFARGAHDLWAATAVHILVLLLVAAGLLAAWRTGTAVRLPALVPAALLLGVWILSTRGAGNRFDAIFATKDLGAALLVFFLAVNVFRSERSERMLLAAGALTLVVQAVLIVRELTGPSARALGGEAPGTLINANVQAAYVLFWLPPLISRWRTDRGVRASFLWLAGLIATVVLLIGTASAWAAVCVVVPTFLLAALTAKTPAARAAFLVAAVLIGGAIVGRKLTRTYERTAPWLPPRVNADRADWWRAGLRMAAARPALGIGPGGFPSAFPAFKVGEGQSTRFAHSWPVTILAETGVIGAAAAALFLAAWGIAVYAGGSFGRLPFAAGAALFLLFTAISLGGEYLVNELTLALFFGLSAADAPGIAWRPRAAHAVLAAAVVVLSLPLVTAPFLASRLTESGRADMADHHEEDAIGRFAAATDLDPTAWDAWVGRAAALWSVGRLPEAIEAMDRGCRLNRYDAGLLARYADMLATDGRPDDARQARERAAKLNPRLFRSPA